MNHAVDSYRNHAAARGPVVDVAVDRHFVYSLGEESNLRIWSMELKQVAVIQIDSIEARCDFQDHAKATEKNGRISLEYL